MISGAGKERGKRAAAAEEPGWEGRPFKGARVKRVHADAEELVEPEGLRREKEGLSAATEGLRETEGLRGETERVKGETEELRGETQETC